MTAVDHAELKRAAEGLLTSWSKSRVIYEDHARAIIALLSEIEGLKADRDSNWDEFLAERTSRMEHGAREAGYLDTISRLEVRAIDAESQLAALRTQAPDSWRPIETAPKDGDAILITRPTLFTAEERWHVVRWDEGDEMWVCHDGKLDSYLRGPDPTHWMPLPAAPALRTQTAESGK